MEKKPRPYYPTKAGWAAAEIAQIRQTMQAADGEPARGIRAQRKARVMARLRAREATLLRLVPAPYDDDLPF